MYLLARPLIYPHYLCLPLVLKSRSSILPMYLVAWPCVPSCHISTASIGQQSSISCLRFQILSYLTESSPASECWYSEPWCLGWSSTVAGVFHELAPHICCIWIFKCLIWNFYSKHALMVPPNEQFGKGLCIIYIFLRFNMYLPASWT